MSFLETRNKRFKIPFIFIIGVVFLIGLVYFASYLENIPSNETNVVTEEKVLKIRVEENAVILLNGMKVDTIQLEEKLKIQFDGYANPVIQLEIAKNISIDNAKAILEIARRNKYEVILEQ
jgi:biopolymer transport protein ExbD